MWTWLSSSCFSDAWLQTARRSHAMTEPPPDAVALRLQTSRQVACPSCIGVRRRAPRWVETERAAFPELYPRELHDRPLLPSSASDQYLLLSTRELNPLLSRFAGIDGLD
jgi:hypothetical protein